MTGQIDAMAFICYSNLFRSYQHDRYYPWGIGLRIEGWSERYKATVQMTIESLDHNSPLKKIDIYFLLTCFIDVCLPHLYIS